LGDNGLAQGGFIHAANKAVLDPGIESIRPALAVAEENAGPGRPAGMKQALARSIPCAVAM
jgi:hypothetical protein